MDLQDERDWTRVRDFIAGAGAMEACPSCGGQRFMLDRSLVTAPRVEGESGRVETTRALRLAALICRDCAQVRLFAVDAMREAPGA